MKFEIDLTQRAANHIRSFRKFEQKIIIDSIDKQLQYEPNKETKNRKHLGENELADWELRVGDYRIFYDIIFEQEKNHVKIKAVGNKIHNILYIGGMEVKL